MSLSLTEQVLAVACLFGGMLSVPLVRWALTPRSCAVHGCRLQARYDRAFGPGGPPAMQGAAEDWPGLLESYKESRYVCDVCIHCGRVVNGRLPAQVKDEDKERAA